MINTDNPTKETRQRGQRETLGTLDAQQRNNKSEIETKTHTNNIQKPRTMTGISPKRKKPVNLLCVTTITTVSPQFPVIQLSLSSQVNVHALVFIITGLIILLLLYIYIETYQGFLMLRTTSVVLEKRKMTYNVSRLFLIKVQ